LPKKDSSIKNESYGHFVRIMLEKDFNRILKKGNYAISEDVK